MRPISINEGEAIIDPLCDPALSELDQWAVEPGAAHGLSVHQYWCWAAFEWARRPAVGPALRMSRRCDVDCSDYDRLLLSVMAPEGAVVRLLAETNCGPRRLEAAPAGSEKRELALELDGATRLQSVTIEVDAGGDGIAGGWFNWLGLQHSGRLARKLAAQTAWDARWEKHLKDESFEPTFTPAYGLVLSADELAALRERHATLMADGSPSPFREAAEAAAQVELESLIHDFVNCGGRFGGG